MPSDSLMPARIKKNLTGLILLFSLSLTSSNVQAKGFLDPFKDPDDGWIDGSDWLLNNAVGFMPLPIFITEPAIGAGLGVAGLFFHPPKDPDPEAEFVFPSVSAVAGAITSNDTWFVGGGHFGNWKQDSIRYSGFVGYASVNIKFYPTFGDVDPEIGLKFNAEGAFVSQELLFRMGRSHFWLGANQELAGVDVDFEIEGLPPVDADALEVTSSALGLTAKYENVDSTFTPSRGLIAKLQYLRYDESIASDFSQAFLYKRVAPNSASYAQTGIRLTDEVARPNLHLPPIEEYRGSRPWIFSQAL
jgi:hypothetical protein